ncbi:MAG: OmpA family protein [Alphaproteobacteria bacterium]|nr:MAG: OmpA family protein [Alphaproteobacteria bacterium]
MTERDETKGEAPQRPSRERQPRERKPWRAAGRLPFIPFGLVPLVGMVLVTFVALAPFAIGEVQAPTEAAAKKAIEEVGADWATFNVSGQWVVLEGKPPSREAANEVLEAVRKAKAPTLFGDARPATWVYDRFTWTEDPLMPLSGGEPRIGVDGQSVDAPPAASTPPPTAEQIATCDLTMARLLSAATIEFDTASTSIGAASDNSLTAIARAITYCRGVLRIEGHTDNVGKAASNNVLSRKRAEAVRAALIARGVPAERLVAEGFGSAKPVASNNNDNGRARNRRIEIRSVHTPT